MSEKHSIAVVGATGAVGETMLQILAERKFPAAKVHALASERSVGKTVSFGRRSLTVENLADFDFSQARIGLFSAGSAVSEEYAPIAAQAGCVVIDNTSRFRYEDDIPLVVPEVNPERIADFTNRGVIANPNCSTIQLVVALKPIHDQAGLSRVNIATYQSVSGAGKSAIEALAHQTAQLLNGRPVDLEPGARQIAFNAVPHIDRFEANGYTREEMKMVWETQKIIGDTSIAVNATAVRIPVFYGHSEAVHLETVRKISALEVKELLRDAPGVTLLDDEADYPTAVSDAAGKDAVFVGRVRDDLSHAHGVNLWVVSDNIRKGAALNSVQIAEILAKNYL